MNPELTVGTVFCNGVHAVRLLWRSYYFHNRELPVKFWGWDNASTDGAAEYVGNWSNRLFRHPAGTSHQQGIDGMVKECSTEFFLLLDFDVEFTGPFTSRALSLLKGSPDALCVSFPSGNPGVNFPVGNFGLMNGTRRINPCCALFRTEKVKFLLERFSFGTYFNFGPERRFFEVGAMIRQVAETAGMEIMEPEWISNVVTHYGEIGSLVANHALTDSRRREFERRYAVITRRSELYEEPPETFGNP